MEVSFANEQKEFICIAFLHLYRSALSDFCARLGEMVYFYSGSFFHSLCTLSHAKERL